MGHDIAPWRWRNLAAGAVCLAPFVLQSVLAQPIGEACEGSLPKEHSYGGAEFSTNSRAEDLRLRQYRYGIISCVSNHDKDYPLYVRWFIPGPNGWVPPIRKLDSTPRLVEAVPVVTYEGCLQYGNRGDTTKAFFFGTASDKKGIDGEIALGCRASAMRSDDGQQHALEELFFRIRNYFPSDSKNPKLTFLQLDGVVSVKPLSPTSYLHHFGYELTPYEERGDGEPSKMTLRPAFRGTAEVLLSSFLKAHPKEMKMGETGDISFVVSDIKSPRLTYGSYEIFDQNDQAVGAINFPAFSSSSAER